MDTQERIEIQESMKPCKLGHHRRYLDVVTGACTECARVNDMRGRVKPQSKRQWTPLGDNGEGGYPVVEGKPIDPVDFARYLDHVLDDPIRKAQFMAEGRRPGNCGRGAYGIALRAATREPMLNADPAKTRESLEGRKQYKGRLDKLPAFKRIVVKPSKGVTGQRGWMERMWSVHQLKYGRGVVAVTDDGDETLVFPQYSDLRKSIIASGWQIIREDVKTGGNTR